MPASPGRSRLTRSFVHAGRGFGQAIRTERNLRIHLVIAVAVIALTSAAGAAPMEWAVLTLCIATVIAAELLNTAIEAAVDLSATEQHPLAQRAKDTAAAAVLVVASGAAVIGLAVFGPKWLALVL